MNIVLIVMLFILFFLTLQGWRKGILGIVYGLVSWIFIFIFVSVANPYILGYLKTETNYLTRTFSYSYDGVNYTTVDVLDNVYYLCDEGLKKGKRFTGAMIGMYAYAGSFGQEYTDDAGNHGSDTIYGEFDFFNYKTL